MTYWPFPITNCVKGRGHVALSLDPVSMCSNTQTNSLPCD